MLYCFLCPHLLNVLVTIRAAVALYLLVTVPYIVSIATTGPLLVTVAMMLSGTALSSIINDYTLSVLTVLALPILYIISSPWQKGVVNTTRAI